MLYLHKFVMPAVSLEGGTRSVLESADILLTFAGKVRLLHLLFHFCSPLESQSRQMIIFKIVCAMSEQPELCNISFG